MSLRPGSEKFIRSHEVWGQQHADRFVRSISSQMLQNFPNVRRWEVTDDIAQYAMIRLIRALRDVTPKSRRHFENLAALQVRRTLIDIARKHARTLEMGCNRWTPIAGNSFESLQEGSATVSGREAIELLEWAELHETVDRLSPALRETFQLIWYRDLSKNEVAELTDVDVRTVQRRWRKARSQLAEYLPAGCAGEK